LKDHPQKKRSQKDFCSSKEKPNKKEKGKGVNPWKTKNQINHQKKCYKKVTK
jgi:hypothetical protein